MAQIQDEVKVFKAFCDENRLRILRLLQTGEKCSCSIQETLTISQSTLSHHMKILVESGLVTARKSGKWTYFSLCSDGSKVAKDLLDGYVKQLDSQVRTQDCDD